MCNTDAQPLSSHKASKKRRGFSKKRLISEMNFRINRFFLIVFIFGAILLTQESRSNPIENSSSYLVNNILPDADFWRESALIDELTTDKYKSSFVDLAVDNNISAKNGVISTNVQTNDAYFFKAAGRNNMDYQSGSCIFCSEATSDRSKSFLQASSVAFLNWTGDAKYIDIEAMNGVYSVPFFGVDSIEIGFFQTLAMIGFGFLIGILKFLRLNNFAMIEVHSRNGEIVGAPVGASIGTGSVASRPRETAHRTPLYLPPRSVPGAVAMGQRW